MPYYAVRAATERQWVDRQADTIWIQYGLWVYSHCHQGCEQKAVIQQDEITVKVKVSNH